MAKYKHMQELVFKLSKAGGVAGVELAAAEVAKKELSKYMPASVDALGNITGKIEGAGVHILLDAHIDQIGMIVTSIDDDGFVKVDKCGGIDIRILAAHEVTVWGDRPLFGVVTSTPPHLAKKDDTGKARDFDETAIDVGLSKDEATALICPGDRVTLNGPQRRLLGSQICSPALDDRAGVASVLRCLEIIKDEKHNCQISVLFYVQEETGGSGAHTGGYTAAAEESIAVDVSFAYAPGMPREKCGEIGKGTMLGISPILDHTMGSTLEKIAKTKNIPMQPEVMGGRTGTNADSIQLSRGGTKMALLSIPLKNMHTSIEIIDLDDVESTARLMAEYILERGREDV
ncbi:MAG: M42 family metallopeptidase [Clostridiales bacterium]|nr:M42 family metallopeptidase [Clostridiales bacterium]